MPPQRLQEFLQVHMSTAVLLMFAMGILWSLNLNGRVIPNKISAPNAPIAEFQNVEYGWPQCAVTIIHTSPHSQVPVPPHKPVIDTLGTVFNCVVAFYLLWLVWNLGEWRIRLRKYAAFERAQANIPQ